MKATKRESTGAGQGHGIYVDVAKIISATDISNTTILAKNAGKKNLDIVLGVELKFDIGKTFQPSQRVFGDLKYDANTGKSVEWGSAFKIEQLLVITGNEGAELVALTPDEETHVTDGVRARVGQNIYYKLPQIALDTMIGKDILRLSYAAGKRSDGSGKTQYNTWDIFWAVPEGENADLEATKEKMAKSFYDGWKKRKYPKDYQPSGNGNGHEVVPSAAAAETEPAYAGTESAKDDDLPF
jgi:hypothetical protein